MDANTITYSGVMEPVNRAYVVALLLMSAVPENVTGTLATNTSLPTKSGDQITWTRVFPWAPQEAAIVEGVTPAKMPMSKERYTATLQPYGAWAELTEKVTKLSPDNVLGTLVKLCGRNMGETWEKLTLNFLKAGTVYRYAGTGTTRASVSGPILRKYIDLVERYFINHDVQPFNKVIAPSMLQSTVGIPSTYWAIAPANCLADIRHLVGFKATVEYGNPSAAIPAEFGACGPVRFLITRHLTGWANAATDTSSTSYLAGGDIPTEASYPDVFPILFCGKDGFAVVNLKGQAKPEVRISQPGVARGPQDPFGQMGTVAWLGWYAGQIINPHAVYRLEVLATAIPTW